MFSKATVSPTLHKGCLPALQSTLLGHGLYVSSVNTDDNGTQMYLASSYR